MLSGKLRLRPLIDADQFCEKVPEIDNVKAPTPRTSSQISKYKLSRRLCCCEWAEESIGLQPVLRQRWHCSKQFHGDKRCWKSPQEGKRGWFYAGCAIRQENCYCALNGTYIIIVDTQPKANISAHLTASGLKLPTKKTMKVIKAGSYRWHPRVPVKWIL